MKQILITIMAAACLACSHASVTVEPQLIEARQSSGLVYDAPHVHAVGNQVEFEKLYQQIRSLELPRPPVPAIDFDSDIVLMVFMGQKPTAGSSIELVSARLETQTLQITVELISPPADAVSAQVITQPYLISRAPRAGVRNVVFSTPDGTRLGTAELR